MTENKRFENRLNRDKKYFNVLNPVWDYEKEDGLNVFEMIEELNALHEENARLRLELDTHKHPLWSTREAERKVNELTELLANETKKNAILLEEINSLRIENMRLKELKE